MSNKIVTLTYTFILFFAYHASLFAQDDIDPHPADDDPPPGAPIDAALIYLMIMGILLAYFAYKRNRKIA